MKVVIPDYIDLLESDKEKLRELGDVKIYDDTPESEEDVLRRLDGAKLIAPSWIDITETIIKQSPHLAYIVVPAVGYDQIDVNAATAAGIKVINCPTHNAIAVAEYTIGIILAISRQILSANRALLRGEWQPHQFLGSELQGKRLGLIGYGTIGHEVAAIATRLGMLVSWATSRTPPDELDTLIASADFLSLHLPLTPKSRHLIDARRLGLMKRSAYLINTARGAIVDSHALLTALKQQQIAGAALDVFENEPVTGEPNAAILELAKLETVLATPHIAYNTQETRERLGQELLANIQACLAGTPINVVN